MKSHIDSVLIRKLLQTTAKWLYIAKTICHKSGRIQLKSGIPLVLVIIGLSGIILLGGGLVTVHRIFGSSDQESSEDEGTEPQEQSDEGEEGRDEGTETSQSELNEEPEAEPAASITDEQHAQEQLALDILTANGLTPLNTTTGANGGITIERCVANSQGQTFCYEPLPTEENCLKPIKEQDPPLCLPK